MLLRELILTKGLHPDNKYWFKKQIIVDIIGLEYEIIISLSG